MLEKIVEEAIKIDKYGDVFFDKLEKGRESVSIVPDFKTTPNDSKDYLDILPCGSENVPDFEVSKKGNSDSVDSEKDVYDNPEAEELVKIKEKSSTCDIAEKTGGAYKDIPSQEGYEKHHIPSDSCTDTPYAEGPCIQMETSDHRQTASCGNSKDAQEYRDSQKELIRQGKFREAFQMDVEDIRDKFGDKYDKAIAQAEEYLTKLEDSGRV